MRDFALVLLLATAAAPALAAGDDERGGRPHRGQSSEQTESRPQRASESPRLERSQPSQPGATGRTREPFRLQREHRPQSDSPDSGGNEPVRNWRRGDGAAGSGEPVTGLRPRERQVRTIPDTQPNATQTATTRPGGVQGHARRDYRDGNYTRWSNHWRRDHRYDWRRHRDRHRSSFRLGFYYDPFGWNYRRWSTGSFLYPSYYGSNFWLNDPWHYRLPPAYGPYRWVRYWDDALLVNIYTGQVVDVIHNFFW